ncbi:Outer membrane protein assembly factor BamB [subsurface metagenome]
MIRLLGLRCWCGWIGLPIILFLLPISVFSQTPGTLKWAFLTGGGIYSSPAIDSDGTIYVGSWDNNLYAINPDGTLKWIFSTDGMISSSPSIGSDRTIYIYPNSGKLYAINPDGTQKWVLAGCPGAYSATFGFDNTIYIGFCHNLYAINPNSSLKWTFPLYFYHKVAPVIGPDETIYIGDNDGKLYAINPDGIVIWAVRISAPQYPWPMPIWASASIDSTGTIYVGTDDGGSKGNLFAINPDGSIKWSFLTGAIWCAPAIGTERTIYVGSYYEKLYSINHDGTLNWAVPIEGPAHSSPAIGSDSTIYISPRHGHLYAFNPDGTLQWKFPFDGSSYSAPVIGSDGTIYFGSASGNLYAIYTSSSGLADSDWPMWLHDERHTGRSECKKIEVDDILEFFDMSVEQGTLVGEGPGKSDRGRTKALRNIIETAKDFIEVGDIESACQQLLGAYKRCDGLPIPPDFVGGDAAPGLADMIQDLMDSLGCS